MKERPILFSASMVRAILEGRKTMTRRVATKIKAPKVWTMPNGIDSFWNVNPCWRETPGELCPYGQPGDRLWVRETWRIGAWNENEGAVSIDYRADGFARREWIDVPDEKVFEKLWIQSTEDAIRAGIKTNEDGAYKWEPGESPCRWRPSIFMPRNLSRITLEITNVRVERLNDISTQDVFSEGMEICTQDDDGTTWGAFSKAQARFVDLWESINGPGTWDANPWVWVVEFKRIET